MNRRWLLVLLAGIGSTAAVAADKPATPAEQAAVAEAIGPCLVRVEYTLRYDKGEAPEFDESWSGPMSDGCESAFQWCRSGGSSAESYVAQERPYEAAGFVVAPDRIVTHDIMIHPRFLERLEVCFGDQRVNARTVSYARNQAAVVLEPGKALNGVKALAFDAKAGPPYLAVSYAQTDGRWTIGVEPFSGGVAVTERGRRFSPAASECVIVDRAGVPAGLTMSEKLAVDDSWKGSPLEWPVLSAGQMTNALGGLEQVAERGLLRVGLSFRSPKKKEGGRTSSRYDEQEDEGATERNVVGILLGGKRVLVLAHLGPSVTARLERVLVYPGQGEPVPAKFTQTLKDYGCFCAELAKPLPDAPKLSSRPILEFEDELLLAAKVVLQGENRVSYYQHSRIGGFDVGWKRHVYPEVAGDTNNLFLFDRGNELVAVPVQRREKVSVRERWNATQPQLTPVAQLGEVLAEPGANSDPSNVPLAEDQENRLAWMGVELQALDKELARVNKVSELTRDGQCGALVTYVYPDSPAAQAGIEPGFILLRLDVEGHPKPLEVQLEDYRTYGLDDFPWDQLDQVPAEYLDQLPTPWPSADNGFTQALTQLGFGTKYQADFFHDGKIVTKDFTVVESPRYYDSAPRYKDEALGLTVRDLTYEVRRQFQKKAEDGGVIVSKIEPGSKAAVAGVKPHEIITQVNDEPVKTVGDFERLIKPGGELRLSVQRMTQTRLVKIRMEAAKQGKPASAPGK